MSCALTVQQRHLALPDCAYFAPSELAIPDSISKERFVELAKGLSRIDSANDFWLADAANFSTRWTDGLDLTAKATGRTKYHLVRVAQVAERFSPAKRFSYTVAHLRWLMPFPDEFLDRFLPSAANLNLSVKALRARAENEFGENPYKPKNPKKRNVPLRADLWARLSEHAPTKVSALIDFILEDWLRREHGGQPLTDAQKQDRYRERKRWREGQGKPAATTYHDDKQHPEASKVPVGACPSSGNDKQSTSAHPPTPVVPETPKPSRWRSFSEAREYVRGLHLSGSSEWQSWSASEARPRDIPSAPQVIYAGQWIDYADWLGRPSYEERRKQQIAEGAQPIPKKPVKKYSLKVQWTECRGESFRDTEKGAVQLRFAGRENPTKFFSEKDAIAAEAEHAKECGYREKVVHCPSCSLRASSSTLSVKIWHVAHQYSSRQAA